MTRTHVPVLFLIPLIAVSVLTVNAQTSTAQVRPDAGKTADNAPNLARILQKLQTKLDESRLTAKFPGAQVGFVFLDGQTPEGRSQYRWGSVSTGVADLQTRAPLKTSDRLLAGSIGKTFVSAVTLLLDEEGRQGKEGAGKLNLDDKIERWLGNENGSRSCRTRKTSRCECC